MNKAIPLYEMPRDKGIEIWGLKSEGKPIIVVFGHTDGAYSHCWLKDDDTKLVHLRADTMLKKVGKHYTIVP